MANLSRVPGITVSLSGGLGNQLSYYATGRSLALTHECPLYLDSSWYRENQARQLELENFRYFGTLVNGPSRTQRRLNRAISWTVRNSRKVVGSEPLSYVYRNFQGERCFVRLDFEPDPHIARVPPPMRVQSQVHLAYFADKRSLLRQELTDLPNESTNLVAARSWLAGLSNYVAVHVRRGDYTNASSVATLGKLSQNYYQQALRETEANTKASAVVLFSDDPKAAHSLIEPLVKLPVMDVSSFHLRAFEELVLMSEAPTLVTANSTFSWWAGFLSGTGAQTVVAPKPFFRRLGKSESCPPDWLRVTADWDDV